MKITNSELNIQKILSVTKATFPVSAPHCSERKSDCFVYVLSGSAKYTFSGKDYFIEPGDIIYLAYKSTYDIEVTVSDYSFIFIDFFFEFKNAVMENAIYKNQSQTENLFYRFLNLWTIGNFSDKILCKSILYDIYSKIVFSSICSYIPSIRKNQLEAAVKIINLNYTDPSLTVKYLADAANMSEGHFRRTFFAVYHTTPVKFITSLRLNLAKQLLISSNFGVSKIASMCGFSSAYYFDRVFKKFLNATPGEYKRKNFLLQ